MNIENVLYIVLVLGNTHAGTIPKVLPEDMANGLTLEPRDETRRAVGGKDVRRRKGVCENGWIGYSRSCYYFSLEEELLSWPNALLACRAKGGYLAEIADRQENRFIETQARFLGSTAKRGRLDTQGAYWCAARNDVTQWIQANLDRLVKVSGVVTQGMQSYWVKTFVVYYSSDCSHWSPVEETNGSEKIFTGNTDGNTKIINIFPKPVNATCIRINPRTWHSYVSMRFDVLGCSLKTLDPTQLPELSLWLGGTDILQEHEFLWATSGTRITYDTFNDWHARQPDNAGDSEHCLMIDQHSGWHDAACSELKRYVCEKENR